MKLGLAGDTMLGRKVAEALRSAPPQSLFAPELVEIVREADVLVLNLECALAESGRPWPDPRKPFFFRGPPMAVEALVHLGVDCVTLANNHALDFGAEALLETLDHLALAGVRWVGAGSTAEAAQASVVLETGGFRLGIVGVTDHPAAYAAGPGRPGVAFADLHGHGVPPWLSDAVGSLRGRADAILVTPHWGPNMAAEPVPHVRRAARALLDAGATLVAGHSAHVFHGVESRVLYDLGDFVDDYATNRVLRNDLGLFFLVTLDEAGPTVIEAVPIKLDYCHTRLAGGRDAAWIARRFRSACARFGTEVTEADGRLVSSPGGRSGSG
jgi:poly-gamma-glutamate synthesis protein (capsule biosynthesis protein)